MLYRCHGRLGGNYVDAINGAKLIAASADQVVKVQRWRVSDNLPGTPGRESH